MIRWKLMLLLSLALLTACSGADMLDDAALGEQGRFGLVYVSYDHDWAESGQSVLLTSTAQFVRYSASTSWPRRLWRVRRPGAWSSWKPAT
jgi:hypothetical protein